MRRIEKRIKHEEREKVDRWLVSYADFITLLFATFVILYALSQVNVTDFSKLNKSLKTAFEKPNIFQFSTGILPGKSGDSILEGSGSNNIITPFILEYASPKYEQDAYTEIKKEIEELKKIRVIKGVSVNIDDRGLIIKFENADILFKPSTAILDNNAKKQLDKIGLLISQKFMMHAIRVEGNTDNTPLTNSIYPSNWELSSARACAVVRYLSDRFSIKTDLFTAVGYGDTRPIANNKNEQGRAKNKRIEIIVLRNKHKNLESNQNSFIKMNKNDQETYRLEHINAINEVKGTNKKIQNNQIQTNKSAIDKKQLQVNEIYEKESKRINMLKLIQPSTKIKQQKTN